MCNFIKYTDIPSIFSSARVLPGLVADSPVCDEYKTLWQSRVGYYLRGIKTRDYPEHGSRSTFFFSFNNNCPQFNCWIVLLSPTAAKHYTWLSWPQLKEYVFFSFKNNCPHFNCWIILHSPTAAKHYTWLSWPTWGRDTSPSKAQVLCFLLLFLFVCFLGGWGLLVFQMKLQEAYFTSSVECYLHFKPPLPTIR